MSKSVCLTCAWEADTDRRVDRSKKSKEWAKIVGVGEASIRRHWKHSNPAFEGNEKMREAFGKLSAFSKSETTGGKKEINWRGAEISLEDGRNYIRNSGDNPDDYDISVRSIAYGEGLWSNRISVTPRKNKGSDDRVADNVDGLAILKMLRDSTRPAIKKQTGDGVFALSLNDTQFGKDEGGGTPATLARIENFLNQAEDRIKELRTVGRKLGTGVLIGGGDLVEGCVIYPNQSYNIDLDRRGQINTAVGTILNVIDRISPYFDNFIILAARGNHGENRVNGNRTTLHDNDDTLVFEMARLATSRDPKLKHVEYIIADSESGVYVDVAGWRLATTHGDVYAKCPGGRPDQKAHAWYKNMAASRNPIGSADVLIGHHWHHDRMSDFGSCLFRQTSAQDGGSEWFYQSTGEYSEAGMLTFVMTPDSRYGDEKVLR